MLMYCVIKCVKTKRVLKRKFASPVFHNCNAKTQICVTGPQCVKNASLQAIWNFGKETVLPSIVMGHIGPVNKGLGASGL
jgi:hypothetical protein